MRRAAVAFLFLVLVPASADAFELLRVNNNPCSAAQNLFWVDEAVPVSTVRLPVGLQPVAFEARARWNQSVRGFEFRTGSGPSCVIDGIANLEFSDRSCGGAPGDLDGIVALTRSVWRQNGELVDADVLFNQEGPAARSQDVFLEVALHELGHVLGLDHSDACGRSGAGTVMKTFLGSERILFPQADDIEGAEFIYPSGSSNDGTVPDDANSCVLARSRGGSLPALPFLAIPLLLLARRGLVGARRKAIDESTKLL